MFARKMTEMINRLSKQWVINLFSNSSALCSSSLQESHLQTTFSVWTKDKQT